MKLQVYTDFVKPTFKIELLRISTEEGTETHLTKKPPPLKRKHLQSKIAYVPETKSVTYVQELPFVPQSRTLDLKVLKAEREGKAEIQRVFDKERSVFKYWISDSARSLEETACLDMKQWKVRRFCKDEEDYNNVEKTIHRNFEKIKHIFTVLIATTEYPNIGQLSMGNWCEEAKLLDKSLVVSDIDRCFIAANLDDITG